MTRWLAISLLVLGCSSDGPVVEDDPDQPQIEDGLDLPEPAEGFQIRSAGQMIAPGEDVEYCEVVKLPGDAGDLFYVNEFDIQMTEGSHHLIVTAVEVGSETEAGITPGDVAGCPFGARVFGEDLIPVTGSQKPTHHEKFPEGVGRVYSGGQYVVFDYHYLNATEEPILGRAAVNFHTVDESQVTRIARSFGFLNLTIDTPPGAQKTFTAECMFSRDVLVSKLTRHTHQWGTEFRVVQAGGDSDGQELFVSYDYEDVDHQFEEPVLMKAGTGFRFSCSYLNTEDYALRFGVKATDEMCILFGTWWAPEVPDEIPGQGCLLTSTDGDGIAR